uniref:Uncharacterized protein n=1 Tax=Rhizophora mucronata TaxID=61149 RepID=A0A2P2NGN9_RHIMU
MSCSQLKSLSVSVQALISLFKYFLLFLKLAQNQ